MVLWIVNFSTSFTKYIVVYNPTRALFAIATTTAREFNHLNKFMATNLLINPMKLRFYLERYRKENELINVRETFVPTTRIKSLTGKFYAKHDVFSPSDVRKDDIHLIKRQTEMIPKDIYSFRPPTVNME